MSRLLKFISSILLSLLLSNKTYGISFNTNDCGTSKGCLRSPETCTTSENCDFLITYAATNSDTVEFELSGIEDWIAVGFSDNQLMAETDILMCVSDVSQDGHYYADSRQTPQRTVPTPSSTVNISAREFVDNRMKCRVSRVINPGLTNFKDLNRSLFLLAAYGPLGGGGGISHHTLRRSSSERLRLPEAGRANDDAVTAAPGLTHAGGGISQHHTFQQSSTERVRLPEASQANDNVFTTTPAGPTHDSALASWRSTSSSFLSIILSGTLLCLLVE
ncbi:DOMON domain-containing protein FRRS1L-like [Acropora muricata]|uniref:DOMON domain-containing protein FRRS1L-like n=1 Tax=Acropora muricata TaxID=159855 RepID=UPI0034E5D23C